MVRLLDAHHYKNGVFFLKGISYEIGKKIQTEIISVYIVCRAGNSQKFPGEARKQQTDLLFMYEAQPKK